MSLPKIDREKLRARLRQMREQDFLVLLDRAVDLLPQAKLPAFMAGYVVPTDVHEDGSPAASLPEVVTRFHEASLRGDYYEAFPVKSRNCNDMSRGTATWFAECTRLIDRCVTAAESADDGEASKALALIFDLLRQIDDCEKEILFFADDGGTWELDIDWASVLQAWSLSLARSASPPEFASAVVATLDLFGGDPEELLDVARRHATTEQGLALEALLKST